MAKTYTHGLLAVTFLVGLSTGCTYDENDLRAGSHVPTADAAADVSTVAPESDAGIAVDAESTQSDAVLDSGAADRASVAIDGGPDSGIDGGTQRPESGTQRPEVGISLPVDASDDLPIRVSPLDAGDLPNTGVDAGKDGSAIDLHVTEAGRIDGTTRG
jgi:hypothetical protein